MAAGGSSATGGVGGSGTGGSAGVSGGTTGGAGGLDSGADAPDVIDGGLMCQSTDAGADASEGEWRDWAAGVCRACPASPIGCAQLLGPPVSVVDFATRQATVHVAEGTAEVTSGSAVVRYRYLTEDNATFEQLVTLPIQVSENTITIDLAGEIPPDIQSAFVQLDLTLTDACGRTTRSWTVDGKSLVFDLPIGGVESVADASRPPVVGSCAIIRPE